MWGIVIQIIENNIYLEMDNGSKKVIINKNNLEIINDNIVNIQEYNEQLYIKIKSLEKKLKKNNN